MASSASSRRESRAGQGATGGWSTGPLRSLHTINVMGSGSAWRHVINVMEQEHGAGCIVLILIREGENRGMGHQGTLSISCMACHGSMV